VILEDKLSRLSALHPRGHVSNILSGTGADASSEQFLQLLGGEIRVNHSGSHVRLLRRFAQPQAAEIDPRALRLIGGAPEDVPCDLSKWLFLDTETTGLAGGAGTYAFLVGLAWWENGGFVVEQLFMRNHGEESSLMLALQERLAPGCVLVTFNGKSFDWPLLQTRFKLSRMESREPLAHLDLLHPARRLWRLNLKSVALAQLEQHVLQLDRGHDIPSGTIPQRYFDFLRGGPVHPIIEVFQHNQMDLCGLAFLLQHMVHLLSDPEEGDCCGNELFGISRMLQKHGDDRRAERLYRRAIERELSGEALPKAQRELALIAKRNRNLELSNSLWMKLLGDSTEGLRAYEQLAIYYEHHASLPQTAAQYTHEALVKLQESFHSGRIPATKYRHWHSRFHHRLARLEAKAATYGEQNRPGVLNPR